MSACPRCHVPTGLSATPLPARPHWLWAEASCWGCFHLWLDFVNKTPENKQLYEGGSESYLVLLDRFLESC